MYYVKFTKFFFGIIDLILRKYIFIIFLIFQISFTFSSLARDTSSERNKNIYLLSQSFKLGTDSLKGAFFSADNQKIIALLGSSSLEIYRIQNGKRLRVIPSQEQNAISLIIHPGGKKAVTGGTDETIRIWDTNQTTIQGILRGHLSPVPVITLNTEGEILASGSVDGTVILWDLKKQELLKSKKITRKGSVKSLAFHPQEKILAVGVEDGAIQFRKVPDLNLIFTLPSHKKSITDLEFNSRGNIFVSCSEDGKLIIWDWKVKKSLSVIEFKNKIIDLSINPKREELAVGTEEGEFETWSLEKGTKLNVIKKFEDAVKHVKYDTNGERILTAIDDGSVHIWEYGSSLYLRSLSGHEKIIESMDFSSNSESLISSASDKSVRIWNLNKEKNENFKMGNHRVLEVRFVPNSQNFVTAGTNGSLKIWDSRDGSFIRDLKFHKGKINTISFHPKEPVLLSAGSDKHWALWDIKSSKLILSRKGHSSQILAATFSPKGNYFATAGSDRSVIIWKYPQGDQVKILKVHKEAVTTLDFSPNGKLLASGSQDSKIFLWKIEPEILNNPHKILEGHDYIVNQVFFSEDGKALVSISKDKTMRLWGVRSGKLLRIMHGDSTQLVSTALSPNGKLIALSNLTKKILILEFPTYIKELQDNFGVDDSKTITIANLNDEETSDSVLENSDNTVIVLDDLEEDNNHPESIEEFQAYVVQESTKLSNDYNLEQSRLNQLHKINKTCFNALKIEELAMKILNNVPNDLAAYHALVKVSIAKGDFKFLRLLLKAASFSKLDTSIYDYLPKLDIRSFLDKIWFKIFDQAFVRRGNIQKIELENCKGKLLPTILSDISRNLFYPEEFLQRITTTPRMIDLRDFIDLEPLEFQNRMFPEIDRIIDNGKSHHSSRTSKAQKERSESIPFGMLNINLERVQTFKNEGVTPFFLRKEGGKWRKYYSDRDNQIFMWLQSGRYSLKVSEILRKTFILIPGTQINLVIE